MSARSTLAAELARTLTAWRAPDAEREGLRRDFCHQVAQSPPPLHRDGPPTHFTASCFVLDPDRTHIALTLHRKAGLWLQFGGHLEERDASPAAAALREAREESGLTDLRLVSADPVDIHRHDLARTFGHCRTHLDVAYVAIAAGAASLTASSESADVSWWPLAALPPGVAPDLAWRLPAVRSFRVD
ncbi:MAG: NUDIX domain-containing protein [Angustibacter sp.]